MSDVSWHDYQVRAFETAIYPESGSGSFMAVNYCVVGLGNEAGEALGKWKKVMRDDALSLSPEKRKALLDEIGDVLWYAANLASELDADLEDIAAANLAKLQDRAARGVIGGSGDNR